MYFKRLVVGSYSQVPVIDYLKNYMHVMNYITFHLLLKIKIHFCLSAEVVDIRTAFLYGERDEEI